MPAKLLKKLSIATPHNGAPEIRHIPDAVIAINDAGLITFAGAEAELPPAFADLPVDELGGRLVTPGLVDCHTHLVWAGSRASEFALRLEGASYEEIARQGGGIRSTVAATRAATEVELYRLARSRAETMMGHGVTTLEVKSGYGLDIDTELRMLRVARRLGEDLPLAVRTTFLGAHTLPPEYAGAPAAYLEKVCLPALTRAAEEGLADAVDSFCETIGFAPADIERLFTQAATLDLPVKLHAEQLSNQQGAALAARFGALSADHLEYLDAEGAKAMARAGTVAVLLPGAFYYLRETRKPPVELLRAEGVPMAVATDCNPGTSPLFSLPLAMNMACVLFGLTPDEAFAGATMHAARALGFTDRGEIAPGKRADLAVWEVPDHRDLCYMTGNTSLYRRYIRGS